MVADPLIGSGVAGVSFAVTVRVDVEADTPQAFDVNTEIFPLVVVEVALIEYVVDVPVQPLGNVQL